MPDNNRLIAGVNNQFAGDSKKLSNLDRIEQDASRLNHLRLKILLRRDPLFAIVAVLIGSSMPVAAQAIRQIVRIPRAFC
jgi:hypothetical protein